MAVSHTSPLPAVPPEKLTELKELFAKLDEDRSGMLSKDEVKDALLLDDDAFAILWGKADTDGDGSITFEEFLKASEAFEEADADNDIDLPGM